MIYSDTPPSQEPEFTSTVVEYTAKDLAKDEDAEQVINFLFERTQKLVDKIEDQEDKLREYRLQIVSRQLVIEALKEQLKKTNQ